MPLLFGFDGIEIKVYTREHLPPHVHAEYGEFEVLIVIETGEVYAGSLPRNKLNAALTKVSDNRAALLEKFYELNPRLYPR
ncbi:MAG: DUF4160 domain-containing protein [Saprospiraceae bacterium]